MEKYLNYALLGVIALFVLSVGDSPKGGFFLMAMLTAVVFPAVLAYRGKGYRGLYLGATLCSLLGAASCYGMSPTARDILAARASGDEAQIRGVEFMASYGSFVLLVWLAASFGTFLGAVLLRPPTNPR